MTLFFATATLLLISVLAVLLAPLFRADKKSALLIAAMISAASAGMYALWGSPIVIGPAQEYNTHVGAIYDTITANSERIKKNPNDLEAWLTMAQGFSDVGDYTASANGFKQAVLISKGEPRIIMAYAEALILQQGGVVSPAAKKSIDIALMIDKDLPLARYYQAVWLLQEGRQPEAMEIMKKLYAELPDDSKLKKRINAQIGR